jgi:uncharacterized protein (DUF697 family)
MNRRQISQVVDLISDAKRDKVSNGEIVKQLVALGIPEEETSNLIECVVTGFQSGVNAVITEGLSAEGYAPVENSFFDLAFERGKAAMRFTTPFWISMRFLAPLLAGAAIIGVVVWKMLR